MVPELVTEKGRREMVTLNIYNVKTGRKRNVESPHVFREVRGYLRKIAQDILIPEPPFTTAIMRDALQALQRGQHVFVERNEDGQATGDILKMAPKIVGVIKEDGTFEPGNFDLKSGLGRMPK